MKYILLKEAFVKQRELHENEVLRFIYVHMNNSLEPRFQASNNKIIRKMA